MKILGLTKINGDPLYINFDHMTSMESNFSGEGTRIRVNDKSDYHSKVVQETTEEIMEMLNEK